MPVLSAHDGTTLAYRESGEGTSLVCLGGGPMRTSRTWVSSAGFPGVCG